MLLGQPHQRQLGIALICLTTLLFATLDACAKWLVQSLPVVQVVWLRFLTHVLITSALLAPQLGWGLVRVKNHRLQGLRGLLLATMTAMNFWALQYLQLAETGAIQFSVPILIAVLSAWWLSEHLDARRWLAILAGFAGVLVIIRPGAHSFHPAILLSLINAVLFAIFNMMTRTLAQTDHPAATQWLSALVATVVLAPFALLQWRTPDHWLEWVVIAITGLCGGLGHFCLALAHRYASAAVLGPFFYQQIIYMTLWGWLLFDQVPDRAVVAGSLIVIVSGLYLLWRELRSSKLATALEP